MNKNRRWLTSFFVFFGFHLLCAILFLCLLEDYSDKTMGLGLFLYAVVWAPIFYVHGYRDRGTKVLLWALLAGFAGISKCLVCFIENVKDQNPNSWLDLIQVGIYVWFFVENLLLREDNKKVREMRKLNPILEETCAS